MLALVRSCRAEAIRESVTGTSLVSGTEFGIPETNNRQDEGPLPSQGAAAPQHCADPPMGWMQPREIGWRVFFSGLEAVRRWRMHSGSRFGNPGKTEGGIRRAQQVGDSRPARV